MTVSNRNLALVSITEFDHTNIPFVDYEDIDGSFQKANLDNFHTEIMLAGLRKERVGFIHGRIGFVSSHGKFTVFVYEFCRDDPTLKIEWESTSSMRGNKTYYAMKIKMNALLETDAWPYMIKLIDSARTWWLPLAPLVNKVEEFN